MLYSFLTYKLLELAAKGPKVRKKELDVTKGSDDDEVPCMYGLKKKSFFSWNSSWCKYAICTTATIIYLENIAN